MSFEIETATANAAPMLCIYGRPGMGKTTFSASFPNSLHILFEDGLPARVQVRAIRNLSTLDGLLGALRSVFANDYGYETLVIDTLDALEPIILESVCRDNGWANIETPSYGKGYILADNAWRRVLAALDHLRRRKGMTIVLLGHSTVEKVEDPRVPIYSSYALRLHRRARALVMDACDVVGFLSTDIRTVAEDKGFNQERIRADGGNMRWLFVEGKPAFMAKNRYGMPPKIAIGPDFKIETVFSAIANDNHRRTKWLSLTLIQQPKKARH
jgi:AAA domain